MYIFTFTIFAIFAIALDEKTWNVDIKGGCKNILWFEGDSFRVLDCRKR